MSSSVLAAGDGAFGDDLIFADGFESGNIVAWDAWAPDRIASVIPCSEATNIQLVNEIAFTDDWSYVPGGSGTLDAGASALWAHAGGPPHQHTITSGSGGVAPVPDGLFASDHITEHGASICVFFLTPGEYSYYCSEHPDSGEQAVITIE